jgi:hypothetical protein
MTEQELRAIVREAIARHADGATVEGRGHPSVTGSSMALDVRQHPSHGLLPVVAGGDTDGPCIIEPAVACNHCGYCKSYGH